MQKLELLNKLKKFSTEELKDIANNPNASYEEIIVASMIVTDREYKDGNYYTMEEVFGKEISNTAI